MRIENMINKSKVVESLSKRELIQLLSYPPDSDESYQVMAEANRLSKEHTGNQAEVHAQFALNLAPPATSIKG